MYEGLQLSTSLLQGLFDAGSVVFHMLQESHRFVEILSSGVLRSLLFNSFLNLCLPMLFFSLRATLEFRVQSTKALHSDFSTMYDRLQGCFVPSFLFLLLFYFVFLFCMYIFGGDCCVSPSHPGRGLPPLHFRLIFF